MLHRTLVRGLRVSQVVVLVVLAATSCSFLGDSVDEDCGEFDPVLSEAVTSDLNDPNGLFGGRGEVEAEYRPGDRFDDAGGYILKAACESVDIYYNDPPFPMLGGSEVYSIVIDRFSSAERLDSVDWGDLDNSPWTAHAVEEYEDHRELLSNRDTDWSDFKVGCLLVSMYWTVPEAEFDAHLERRDQVVEVFAGFADEVCPATS